MNKYTEKKIIKLKFTEINILYYLLSEHIEQGSYFGNRKQHYKMCHELFKKLEDIQ